jgi:hypothetical protein
LLVITPCSHYILQDRTLYSHRCHNLEPKIAVPEVIAIPKISVLLAITPCSHYIPQDRTLYSHRCQILEPKIVVPNESAYSVFLWRSLNPSVEFWDSTVIFTVAISIIFRTWNIFRVSLKLRKPSGRGPLPGPRLINKKLHSVACSPQANYTDRATAACRRS